MDLAPLSKLAARQHGLVTLAQAKQLGWSDRQWRRLLATGVLIRSGRGIAALAGAPRSSIQQIAAVALVAGGDAIVSHTSGALVWGAPVTGTDPVHLTVTDRRRTVHLPGARVHVSADLVDLRPVMRAGLRVTNPVRVLCDVGAVDPQAVTPVLHHFFVTGIVPPDAAWGALDRHSRHGRRGLGPLRAALSAYPLGHKPPDSVLEETFARLLRRHRLPPATFHAVLLGWEVDFHIEGTPVIVECDGWSSHGLDRDQFERDRRKDAELRAAGYVVCRYSWLQITHEPTWTADNLRQVLEHLKDPS